MTEDELLKLSAYADGELNDAERLLLESSLEQAPALRETLDVFGRLRESAILEAVPQPAGATESFWPALERSLDSPDAPTRRICACAAAESAPGIPHERFQIIWQHVAIHTVAGRESSPPVETRRWSGVWSGISGRTEATHSARSSRIALPAKTPSVWLWSIGAGLAASVLLAFLMPKTASNPPPPTMSETTTSASMTVPEAEDEHYGVRVRLVEGSSDPVVTLYFKNSSYDDTLDNTDAELK